MARKRTRAVIERGGIAFYYRPRVEHEHPAGIEDVQRVVLVLAPEGSPRRRVITIGRKRLPRSRQRVRFLAFVDAVEDADGLEAALAERTYQTATRGTRLLPAARPAGRGAYELVAHDGHTHLEYALEVVEDDPVPDELGIERRASWIVTVANPDPAAWGVPLAELRTTQLELFPLHDDDEPLFVPTPFPPELQSRFGERRFIDAGPEFLDHAGAELVLIGAKR